MCCVVMCCVVMCCVVMCCVLLCCVLLCCDGYPWLTISTTLVYLISGFDRRSPRPAELRHRFNGTSAYRVGERRIRWHDLFAGHDIRSFPRRAALVAGWWCLLLFITECGSRINFGGGGGEILFLRWRKMAWLVKGLQASRPPPLPRPYARRYVD